MADDFTIAFARLSTYQCFALASKNAEINLFVLCTIIIKKTVTA